MTGILARHHPFTDPRAWLLSHGVTIALIVVGALVLLGISKLAVRRMQRRIEGAEGATEELHLQRTATLTQAVSYVTRVSVWTVTILLVLDQLGIAIGPLIAGAGIAGVALGFGAQSLVRDFLSGFFILLENQLGVSDSVMVTAGNKDISGKVEAVSLRTTSIRDFEGTLHTIPNGVILVVGNRSRGWARAIIDLRLGLDEDVTKVRGVLDELFSELAEDEELQAAFLRGPEVLGVERFGETELVLRVTAEVRPTRKGSLERELRERIKRRLDERGISMPSAR